MKAISTIIFFGLLCLAALPVTPPTNGAVLPAVAQLYQQQLTEFSIQLARYQAVATDSASTGEQLRAVHSQTRLAYKAVEPLLAYYEPNRVKKQINGAPLPWVMIRGGQQRIKEPVGLQTLDELVVAALDRAAVVRLITQLNNDFLSIQRMEQGRHFYHQDLFMALRQEIIRVFTLGLTGFDTPGTLQALPEAATALRTVRQIVRRYEPVVAEPQRLIFTQLTTKLDGAVVQLDNATDFANFDRLAFLMDYINPIYAQLFDFHHALGSIYFDRADALQTPLNYGADNLFATDFLNPNYYVLAELNTSKAKKRIALGKRLFHDTRLSAAGTMSCATCHDPKLAFTDGRAKSLTNDGISTTLRNSPTLLNAVYTKRYFYDLREQFLEEQMDHVVLDAAEFSTDYRSIVRKLRADTSYVRAFAEATQLSQEDRIISQRAINYALAAYVASLQALDSPFDRYVRGERAELSDSARRGFNLFMGKAACGTCHFAPIFNGTVPPFYDESESEVLGVPATKDTLQPRLDSDLGRYGSGAFADRVDFYRHSFKTTTVRNVELTAPYMHNGVYQTLAEVVEFYNRGGGTGLGLTVPHQTLAGDPLELTVREQADLVAFMESLTNNPSAKR